MKQYAVIVAGGQGLRMQTDLPKQFICVAGKPILMHTLEAFYSYSSALSIIVVLPENEHNRWEDLCLQFECRIPHQVVKGGSCRPFSVQSGLQQIEEEESLVAIHDGVRPLVTPDLIARTFTIAEKYGSAIASIPLKDSIREISDSGSHTRDRSLYRLMQTPQTFRTSLIAEAYRTVEALENFSDDAGVLEAAGNQVRLTDGEFRNIKVTTPEDLRIAEAFLT